MEDESPYAPPASNDLIDGYEARELTRFDKFRRWLLRVVLMFVGSLMFGMSFAMLLTGARNNVLLTLAAGFIGGLLFLVGMRNRLPKSKPVSSRDPRSTIEND